MAASIKDGASSKDGIVFAYLLDGHGGAAELDSAGCSNWVSQQGPLWVHLDLSHPNAEPWLRGSAGLESLICDALVEEQARPRALRFDQGLLLVLRGMNFNPGADPHDMVVIRTWFEPMRAITIRRRKLPTPQHIAERIRAGQGPRDTAELLVEICEGVTERMMPIIEEIGELTDDLDQQVAHSPRAELRSRLTEIRIQTIALRRYLAPQRDALVRLHSEPVLWIGEKHRTMIRETADSVTRYVEDLDEAQDHIAAVQDQLSHELAENLNRSIYRLSILAAIFLPMTLVTGLLGVNVAGIPGAKSPLAFLVVCLLLVLIACAEILFFRRMKWF